MDASPILLLENLIFFQVNVLLFSVYIVSSDSRFPVSEN